MGVDKIVGVGDIVAAQALASVAEEDGEGVSSVGGDVEGGALLSVHVADSVRVGDESGPDRGSEASRRQRCRTLSRRVSGSWDGGVGEGAEGGAAARARSMAATMARAAG